MLKTPRLPDTLTPAQLVDGAALVYSAAQQRWVPGEALRSTGWRNITTRFTGAAGGSLLLLREGNTVWMDFQSLVVSTTDQSSMTVADVLPAGFRPPRDAQVPLGPRVYDAANELKGSVRVYPTGAMSFYRVPGNGWARGVVSFRCSEPWPATLPGTPV